MTTPPERSDLPEGSFINGEILITSYIGENGKLMYATKTTGTLNLAQALGLVVLGGIAVFRTFEQGQREDEEEE